MAKRGSRRKKRGQQSASASNGASTGKSKPKGRGRRYSEAERNQILATARREGLSGPKAARRFGISTLTYYTWRKKAGQGARAGRGRVATSRGTGMQGQIKSEIQARIREMLPQIVEQEIEAMLGGSRGRRGRR